MNEKRLTNEIKKLIKISQSIKKKFVVIFSGRVLYIPKNIDDITMNKW